MACKAPSNIGVLRLRPQSAIGTPAVLQSTDGLRVEATPEVEALGEGRIDNEEVETPLPGGQDPVLGSYGEALTLQVAIPICDTGELISDHAFVRLLRACGFGVSIDDGTATINELVGGCVGTGATDRVPLTIEWAQGSGLTHRWQDCIGALVDIDSAGGGTVLATFRLVCRVTSREDTDGALPAVTYPGQALKLTGRGGAFTLAGAANPDTLYSWTLSTGVEAQEVESQLEEAGMDVPFSYGSSPATLGVNTAQEDDYSEEQWDAFFGMASLGALVLKLKGLAPNDILEIEAPRPFSSPQEMGSNAGHRTDGRELLLKPSGTTPRYTIKLNERASS